MVMSPVPVAGATQSKVHAFAPAVAVLPAEVCVAPVPLLTAVVLAASVIIIVPVLLLSVSFSAVASNPILVEDVPVIPTAIV